MGVTLRDKEKTWVADGKKRKKRRVRGPRKTPAGRDSDQRAVSSASAIDELALLVEDAATALEEVAAMEEADLEAQQQVEAEALQADVAPAPSATLAPVQHGEDSPHKPATARERLIALKELLELGLIFPDEFAQKRADILQELTDG